MSVSSLPRTSRTPREVPSRTRRYRKALRHLEMLEPRTLLSTTTLYDLPDRFMADQATYDNDDNLWVINLGGGESSLGPTLARVADGAVAEAYDLPIIEALGTAAPVSLLNGGNGHLYITDFNGAINEFDLATKQFTQYAYSTGDFMELADASASSTMTADGGLWFVGLGSSNPESTDVRGDLLHYVVRFDTLTHTLTHTIINDFDASVGETTARYIAPRDGQSVYVGLQARPALTESLEWVVGTSRIATVSFDGLSATASTTGVYTLDTGDTDVDQWGVITGLASDTDNTLWISIGNFDDGSEPPFAAPAYPTDRLVNVAVNAGHLDTLATVELSVAANPLGIRHLVLDAAGRLWFNETTGTHLGYFDTFEATVTRIDYPAGVEQPYFMAANHAGTELTMLTIELDSSFGYPIVQVTFDAPTVEFSGEANNQALVENVASGQLLLAIFTAQEAAYTAVITWGDGTTETVQPIHLGGNLYSVIVSGKTFASQGTFAGSISIVNESSVEAGVLTFSTIVSDTPLEISSLTITNPMGKFADLFLTFTDDATGDASWFVATIAWGDGSTSTGLVIEDASTPGQYFVIASHKYKKKGSYSVLASITTSEVNAQVITASATVTVLI